ncbi:MAG: ABC transporter ATP-binding protein [Gammaproteobacteria bacterium]|nr:ABC transporter ATP-binding protein [Gammaproteobacteria bacterium]
MHIDIQHKPFQEKVILGDIRFELVNGKTTVLFGPSGCGKTTLLRILAGLDSEFVGQITETHHRLGFVFQEPYLLPWRTVRENVTLVAPNNEPLVEQMLYEVGLQEHASLDASKLSLGMARRVSLARALAFQPEVLILDEPFVSMNEELANQLRLLLLHITEQYPMKVLMVTHNPHEAVQLAHRILTLGGNPTGIKSDIPIYLSNEERRNQGRIANVVKDVSSQLSAL